MLRKRMHYQNEFKIKNHLKLDAHRQFHGDTKGCKIEILEEKRCIQQRGNR
jgi:hypothetical protein